LGIPKSAGGTEVSFCTADVAQEVNVGTAVGEADEEAVVGDQARHAVLVVVEVGGLVTDLEGVGSGLALG